SEGRHGQRRRQDADLAAGHRDHRAGDPEDLRLLPRDSGRRTYRANLHGGRFVQGAGPDRGAAAGILAAGGAVESGPEDRAPGEWIGGRTGGKECGTTRGSGGIGPEEFRTMIKINLLGVPKPKRGKGRGAAAPEIGGGEGINPMVFLVIFGAVAIGAV